MDPNQTVEIRNLIKEISQERTVILSTHNFVEVQATCDHIRMVEEGRVVFAGTVEEFDNYIEPNTIICFIVRSSFCRRIEINRGILEVEELGGTKYRLKFADTLRKMVERIVETSVKKGWRLNEIRLERSSIDTIFC